MRRPLAFFGVALLVAVSCTAQPSGPSQASAEKPVPGGRIVIGSFSDLKTMQPVISKDSASTDRWGWLYIGLTRANPETGASEPYLAEKFVLSPDGLTLTYTLRDGLVWSDGSPFTGEDYKFTAEATVRSKQTARKDRFTNVVGAKDYETGKAETISGIQVSDNGKTITIKFDKAFCAAVSQFGSLGGGIIPKKVFGKYLDPKDASKNLDDAPENMNPTLSMGPFVFKEYKSGDRWVAVRNEKFFRGAPLVDELVVKVYADATAVKAALLIGEVTYNSVEAKDYEEVRRSDILKEYRFSGSNGYTYIGWNQKSKNASWLTNKNVRQALWYGINVEAIYQKIVFGLARRQFAHVPAMVGWAYEESQFNKYPYDANKAKQLLEAAGAKMGPDGFYRWTDGKTMKIKIETNQGNNARETMLQFAQEQYKQIGIQVDPLLESFPALAERVDPANAAAGDVDGFILGWIGLGPDPDPFSIWHSSNVSVKGGLNSQNYANPQLDKLIEQARNGPDCSTATRGTALKAADKILNEEAPYTFLYSADQLVFVNKAVQGADPKPWSTTSDNRYNVEKWWFKQ